MLNLKLKRTIYVLVRFIACWLISTLIFTIWTLMQSKLNYGFRDKFLEFGFIILIISIIYFGGIIFFKTKFKIAGNQIIFGVIVSIIISLSFALLWGNPIKGLTFFESLLGILKLGLIGLSISLTDYFIHRSINMVTK